ncbi:hypothetical protein CEP52_009159 [Fusarium oligoseptatum]|uniref:Uncharacterized protein n=1 Tax=Fusarium oligoseptatum TaxID=2604345 RepID=A0A428TEB7_9HYPO|nr:hypothetical protein CEP52_009159 [Fusarium oligoseptatum]
MSTPHIQTTSFKRTKEEEDVISWCDKYDQQMQLFLIRSARWGRSSEKTGGHDALDTKIDKLFKLTEALRQQCDLYKQLTPKKKTDGRPDHDAYHLHHREWVFSRNIIKAFRLLPKKMQSNIEMTFGPLHSLVEPPEVYRGKGQAQMDMRGVLGIMLANPTQPARDVILNMTGAQASLVLRCADYSFSRLLDRMLEVNLTKQMEASNANDGDWRAYYYALMNYRGLWRSWKPASPSRPFPQGKQGRMSRNLGAWSDLRPGMLVRELGPDSQFIHDSMDERGGKTKPRTDEICKAVHDFAVAGGTPHIDHLVNDIWDWVTAPDYAFSARPGDSLLGAMQLPESLQRNPKIKPLGPEDLVAVFGPAIGDLATVLSYFQLALWVSTGMTARS